MKKFIYLSLIFFLAIVLISCKKENNEENNNENNTVTVSEVTNLDYYTSYQSSDKTVHYFITFTKANDATSYIIRANSNEIESKRSTIDITEYVTEGRNVNVSVRSVNDSSDKIVKSDPVLLTFHAYKMISDLEYTQIDDNTYSVSAYNSSDENITGDIAIPDYYDNKKITVLEKESFARRSISSVGGGASHVGFGSNTLTTKLALPRYLEVIEDYGISLCSNLTDVIFGSCLREIGYSAFSSDASLKNMVIPESVEVIGDSAFMYCRKLESITLSENVYTIGQCAFASCSSLKEINNLTENIRYVGRQAFMDCLWLDNQTGFVYINDICLKVENEEEKVYTASMFKKGVRILQFDFNNNQYIESFEMPNSVVEISMNFFYNSTIKELTFEEGCSLEAFPEGMFTKCLNIEKVYIPKSVKSVGDGHSCFGLSNITEVVYEETPEVLSGYANMKFESFTVPDGVKVIAKACFFACSSLKEVKLPNSLVEIQDQAFASCYALESIDLPSNLKIIGSCGFTTQETNGQTLTVPESSSGAFYNSGIKNIIIPDVTTLGWSTFSDTLESIILPKYIKNICSNFVKANTKIYYMGSLEDYNELNYIKVGENAIMPSNIYYFSESEPTSEGQYWHFVNGAATEW